MSHRWGKSSGVVVLALMVTFFATITHAQVAGVNPGAYVNAVDDYSNGRPLMEVVAPLQLWGKSDLETAVDRLILTRDKRRIEMAAILQLEIGLGIIAASPDGAEIHFNLGDRLLKGLPATSSEPRDGPQRVRDLQQFSAVWYGVASSGYLSVTNPKRAAPWIEKAIQLAPKSAALKTIEGAVNEIDANGFTPDRFLTLSQKSRATMERLRRLAMAEGCFRDAVEADPSYAKGHIMLGRVQFLLGKIPQSRQQIERGLALAKLPAEQYLAALFLGGVKEQQRDAAGARESYEQALKILPQGQSAMVALAYLDLIAGRPDRAQALARSFASAPADDRAWWAYRNGGLDDEGLATIRARVPR